MMLSCFQVSYDGLVLTAKTSLHYGGVCVWVCVYRGGDIICVVSGVCTAQSRSPHPQSSTISQLKDTITLPAIG